VDRRERLNDFPTALLAALEGWQSSIQTAMPGIIQSFDPVKCTAVIKPALRGQLQKPDGSWYWKDMPLLLDCPVVFPSGGGCTLTFPLAKGDECLVVFGSRCIDAWWQSGDVNNLVELRMHDLSDGFCIPGPKSVPNVPANISTTKVELRTNTGNAKVAITPSTGVLDLTGTTVNINGTLNINGAAYLSHKHSGVQTGPGQTGGIV